MVDVIDYIKKMLLGFDDTLCNSVSYGLEQDSDKSSRIIIIPSSFFEDGIFHTEKSLPVVPFNVLPDTDIPFLFGSSKIERKDGKIILYADLIASSFFLMSRYEETIKKTERDVHGRFLAKNSIVFQQGYGMRPLVDEWGLYLRNLLRELGCDVPVEKKGFSRIYLTHDVDSPFKYKSLKVVFKQIIKNLIHYGKPDKNCIKAYLKGGSLDEFYTFPHIIETDNLVKQKYGSIVESIYFLISKGSFFTKDYFNVFSKRYSKLLEELRLAGAKLGLHISYESGGDSSLIKNEVSRLRKLFVKNQIDVADNLYSRHHYLRWVEPEQISDMQNSGITDDFTLGYADSVGFRCGTCRPYRFINPETLQLSNVVLHPLVIMDNSLNESQYMGLGYETAYNVCKNVADTVSNFYGELVILFHNTSFCNDTYCKKLYYFFMEYIGAIKHE